VYQLPPPLQFQPSLAIGDMVHGSNIRRPLFLFDHGCVVLIHSVDRDANRNETPPSHTIQHSSISLSNSFRSHIGLLYITISVCLIRHLPPLAISDVRQITIERVLKDTGVCCVALVVNDSCHRCGPRERERERERENVRAVGYSAPHF